MILETMRNVLIAAAPVTAIVGDRVSYVTRSQSLAAPAVLLTVVSTVPQNQLAGAPTLDQSRVQLDVYADSYTQARALATACRNALEAAGYVTESEIDNFEPDVPEFRITQDYMTWT